jgi:endonuclease/exonuclease/phosphatase family metal-dependent hydrolase
MAPDRAPTSIRAVTWNLHGCIGRDGVFDPHRTATLIGRFDADILSVQEVDSRHRLAEGLDTFAFLRKRSGYHGFEARAFGDGTGHCGQMVLSRWPLVDGRMHDISVPGREPRKAIEVFVEAPLGRVRVLAAHFGLRVGERRRQVTALVEILNRGSDGPTVMLGDFNDPRRQSGMHRAVAPRLSGARSWATFPAAFPVLPLDRIWCAAPLRPGRAWVVREARHASDHLPLAAELHWNAPPAN